MAQQAFSHEVRGVRDYYKVLEVPHDATPEEIRRAYRTLALQFHPDRNGGSLEAEERFKELAEAFHTLSDGERREVYDIWGPQAVARGVAVDDTAPNLDDAVAVFVQQFSEFVQEELDLSSPPPPVGPPLHVPVTLAEVSTGVTKEIPLPCARCFGSGLQRVRADRDDVCHTCGGSGEDPIGVTVLVDVPAGAESGDCVRVHRGFGEEDLLAVLNVQDDPHFVRAGSDVVLELSYSAVDGLDSEVEIPTLTGSTRIEIPAGTPVGGALRVPGQGLPFRTRPGNGDLIVKLVADESDVDQRTARAADGPSFVGLSAAWERPTVSVAILAGVGFVMGGTTVWLLGRGASTGASGAWMGLVLTVLLLSAVASAALFLISSLLAFLGAGVKDWIGAVRARITDGRALTAHAMEALEARLRRFAVRERRHPPRPLVVQLDRLADAVEHAGEAQIATLSRLERQLHDDAAHLGSLQTGQGWSADQVAQRLRESARHAADSTAAAPILLLVGIVLGVLDFWVLRQALLPNVPASGEPPFALPLIESAGLLAALLSVGALVSGALRQLFEPLEVAPLRGGIRTIQPRRHPVLVTVAPALLAFVIVVAQTLCFLSIAARIDLSTSLQLAPYGPVAAAICEAALPVAGAALSFLLVALGYGFCAQLRQAFASDADGALARRLRRQSEQRGGAPDLQSLRAHVNELAAAVDGFSGAVTAEFQRATGFGSDQTIARSVRAAAARVSERGGAFVPKGLRSLEQLAGTLVIGTAGFLLLAALLGLLFVGLEGAFATAAPFAGAVPSFLPALAGVLGFVLGGYLLRDALYGSNHVATLMVMLPQQRARTAAAWTAAAALLIGLVFVAWLGAVGQPIEASAALRSLYLVLLAAGAAAVSTNLDGWIVSAYKLGYVGANGVAWAALAVARAGLVVLDWGLAFTAEAVALLSIPGQWVRARVFKPA